MKDFDFVSYFLNIRVFSSDTVVDVDDSSRDRKMSFLGYRFVFSSFLSKPRMVFLVFHAPPAGRPDGLPASREARASPGPPSLSTA